MPKVDEVDIEVDEAAAESGIAHDWERLLGVEQSAERAQEKLMAERMNKWRMTHVGHYQRSEHPKELVS